MAITVSRVQNGNVTPLLLGEIVRARDNNGVVRAQADSVANAQGTIGAMANPGVVPGTNDSTAPAAFGTVSADGVVHARLEAGLVPVVGHTLFLSATAAGRATNVAPSDPGQAVLAVGIITDISPYVSIGCVLADIDPDLVPIEVPGP